MKPSALLLVAAQLFFAAAGQAQLRAISPQQQAPLASDALGSPGIDAGDYVYISGQGPSRPDGTTPANFADQVRQSLENIRTVVEASGLTMDHLVYVQVYLDDMGHYDGLNKAFADYFPKMPPARGIMGVARLPQSPIQITGVAVRNLTGKQPVTPANLKPNKAYSAGMLTHDRLFISSMLGSEPSTEKVPDDPAAQVDLALDRMKLVSEAAGLTLANMVFVNPYLTSDIPSRVMNERYARRFEFGNTPGRATIQVSSLPEGAHIAYTGVAVRDIAQRRSIRPKNMPPSPTASPCVFAGDTLYCSAKSDFIPGPNGGVFAATTANQARQTMRNLLDNLEEADLKFDQVVSTTIYLDDLSDTAEFGKVYRKYFGGLAPAETLAQQLRPADRKADDDGHFPDLEQVSLIAVRTHPNH
jgi:enamine deaminase RidA (YjgF/YER057c/UK114 family)